MRILTKCGRKLFAHLSFLQLCNVGINLSMAGSQRLLSVPLGTLNSHIPKAPCVLLQSLILAPATFNNLKLTLAIPRDPQQGCPLFMPAKTYACMRSSAPNKAARVPVRSCTQVKLCSWDMMLSQAHWRLQDLHDEFLRDMPSLQKQLCPTLSCIACKMCLPLKSVMKCPCKFSHAHNPHTGLHTHYLDMLP